MTHIFFRFCISHFCDPLDHFFISSIVHSFSLFRSNNDASAGAAAAFTFQSIFLLFFTLRWLALLSHSYLSPFLMPSSSFFPRRTFRRKFNSIPLRSPPHTSLNFTSVSSFSCIFYPDFFFKFIFFDLLSMRARSDNSLNCFVVIYIQQSLNVPYLTCRRFKWGRSGRSVGQSICSAFFTVVCTFGITAILRADAHCSISFSDFLTVFIVSQHVFEPFNISITHKISMIKR